MAERQDLNSYLSQFAEGLREIQKHPSVAANVPSVEGAKGTGVLSEIILHLQEQALKMQNEKSRELFARAMSDNSRERYKFRDDLMNSKFSRENVKDSKFLVEEAWGAAEINQQPIPKEITNVFPNPDSIHSPIARDLVASIAVLPPKLREDPRNIYMTVASAYRSIDFQSLSKAEENEIQTAFESVFEYMRKTGSTVGIEIPMDNTQLWRGLGDYYFSTKITYEVPPSSDDPLFEAVKSRNKQRENLSHFLRDAQGNLNQPISQREEQDLLRAINKKLRIGKEPADVMFTTARKEDKGALWDKISGEMENVQERITTDMNAYEGQGGGGFGGKQMIDRTIEAQIEATSAETKLSGNKGLFGGMDEKEVIDMFPNMVDQNNQEISHSEIALRLLQIKKLLAENENQPGGVAAYNAGYATIENMLRRYQGTLTPEQLKYVENCKNSLGSQIHYEQRRGEPVNRIYLTEDEVRALDADPIGVSDKMVDDVVREILRDPSSPLTKVKLDRLELMQYYLFSDQYAEKGAIEFATKNIDINGATVNPDELHKRILERFKGERQRFADSFSIKYSSAQWLEAWSNSAGTNDKRFQELVNRMDENTFFGMDGLYGGIIADVRQMLRVNYQKRIEIDGVRQAMDPQHWDSAVKETVEQISQRQDLKDRYEKEYLKGSFFKNAGENKSIFDTAEHSNVTFEDACEGITNFAYIRMMINGEKFNMDIRFLPPRWGADKGLLPTTFLEKQKVARLMRPIENHFLTWGSFGGNAAIEKAIIRHRSGILRKTCGEIDQWGDEWADRLWKRIDAYKHYDENLAKCATPEERELYKKTQDKNNIELFGELRSVFAFRPDSHEVPERAIDVDPSGLKTLNPDMAKWVKELKKPALQKETRVYAGMLIDQNHMFKPYNMMFESGYRRSAQLRFMNDSLYELFYASTQDRAKATQNLQGVFVSADILSAANDYNWAKYHGDPPEKRNKFIAKIADASHWRPHDIIQIQKEARSQGLNTWWEENMPGTDFSQEMAKLSNTYENLRFRLLQNVEGQIDYYNGYEGLSAGKKDVVDNFFGNDELSKNQYFATMRKLSHHLVGNNVIPDGSVVEMADIRYMPLLTKARWDDYPYELLQYPERMKQALIKKGFADRAQDISAVSDRFIGRFTHDKQSDPWRRQWRDMGGAQDAFDVFGDTFDQNKKVYLTAEEKIFKIVNGYQGPDVAQLQIDVTAGGRMAAERVYKKYGPAGPFMENMKNTSDMNKWGYKGIKAMSVDELAEEFDEDQRVSGGQSVNTPMAEPIREAVESYVGISNWRSMMPRGSTREKVALKLMFTNDHHVAEKRLEKILAYLNDRVPSGVLGHKILLATPFLGLLVGVFTAKTIQEEGKEKHG